MFVKKLLPYLSLVLLAACSKQTERPDPFPTSVPEGKVVISITDDEMLRCEVEINGHYNSIASFFSGRWDYSADGRPYKPAWKFLEYPKIPKDSTYSVLIMLKGRNYGAWFYKKPSGKVYP